MEIGCQLIFLWAILMHFFNCISMLIVFPTHCSLVVANVYNSKAENVH